MSQIIDRIVVNTEKDRSVTLYDSANNQLVEVDYFLVRTGYGLPTKGTLKIRYGENYSTVSGGLIEPIRLNGVEDVKLVASFLKQHLFIGLLLGDNNEH